MKHLPPFRKSLFCGVVLLLLSGCGIPISTMHGPAPTPVNTTTATVGFGPIFFDDEWVEDLLFTALVGAFGSVRHGVSERLELGGSVGMFNGVTAEAKYAVVPGPLFVSVNLAVSGGILFDIDMWGGGSDSDIVSSVGLHPALLVGTERVYGGAKLLTFPFNRHVQRPWTVVFAGGSFGGRIRLVPEIAWMRDPSDGETAWVGGIGLQVQEGVWPLR
jgi:hypothetical protein